MTPIIISSLIFVISLWLIFSEKLNRTITGFGGAFLMVAAGKILGFYSEEEAISSIDWNTMGLLAGMMILVSLLEPTGFFQFLAVWVGRLSKGRPMRLLVLLGIATTVLSMFLDNVTTVVLIAPVTVLICEILGLKPAPFLMAEALLSNTGGVSTLVGDPPNVLIASAANFTFLDFIIHSLPIVAVVWIAALFLLRFLFREELAQMPLDQDAIYSLDPNQALHDRKTAVRVLIVVLGAIIFFFLQGALRLTPSFVAMSAAAVALVWVRPGVEEVLKRVEWSVLSFFGALFVMVGGLEKAGALEVLVSLLEHVTWITPALFGVLIIWAVAILSSFVDNIPITIALIPVIQGLGVDGMNITPIWWALAFGAGFGGNGTIIGSSANIVVALLSEKTRTPITSAMWNKRGLPVMILACSVVSVLYVILFPWLS